MRVYTITYQENEKEKTTTSYGDNEVLALERLKIRHKNAGKTNASNYKVKK